MGVRFETPAWLLLLIPALLVTFIPHLAARRRIGIVRRRLALTVRTLLLAALVFALAGFQLILPVDRLATVFVVDLSDSVGNQGRENALAFLRESLDLMPDGDAAGVVAFGKDALVERLPEELRTIDRLRSTPVAGATDIGEALRLASALFPDEMQKRIVLISDGNDTTGRGQQEAALAAVRGIQVETRAVGLEARDEVLVDRLQTPSTARLGETVEAVATIDSSVDQPATVRLYADGGLVAANALDLLAGSNRIVFEVIPAEAGFHTFRVVVEAARDTFSQNNRADSNTIVKGEPRILVLAGNTAVAAELVAALEVERQLVDSIVPEALPTDFAGLVTYDSVVLVDVPRIRLSDRQLAALQVYVRDLGRGLVMVGGPDSFGAGGYSKTPLEETLPVDMGVRNRQQQPDIALVVVIDKSGSMDACHCNSFQGGGGGGQLQGVRKVDIGKEAILRAAAALTARDELGVVAFDEQAHWVVQTKPLGQIADLQGDIAGISPNGTTNIYSGLDQAVGSLEKVSATRRHIILLTDGWSSSGQYDEILARMKAAGITLSTVGAGRWGEPLPPGARDEGRRALLRRGEPRCDPRHLPQGDRAGRRAADHRGAVLPDPDLLVADPPRPGPGLSASPRLQRDDRQVGRADGPRDRPRRPAPCAMAVRPGSERRLDLRLDEPLGDKLGWLAGLREVLQPARGLDVPGRGDRRHRGVVRDRGRPDAPPRGVGRVRWVAARLLHDVGGSRGPGAGTGRIGAGPGRAGSLRDPTSGRSTRGPMPSGSPRSARARRRSGARSGWLRR